MNTVYFEICDGDGKMALSLLMVVFLLQQLITLLLILLLLLRILFSCTFLIISFKRAHLKGSLAKWHINRTLWETDAPSPPPTPSPCSEGPYV